MIAWIAARLGVAPSVVRAGGTILGAALTLTMIWAGGAQIVSAIKQSGWVEATLAAERAGADATSAVNTQGTAAHAENAVRDHLSERAQRLQPDPETGAGPSFFAPKPQSGGDLRPDALPGVDDGGRADVGTRPAVADTHSPDTLRRLGPVQAEVPRGALGSSRPDQDLQGGGFLPYSSVILLFAASSIGAILGALGFAMATKAGQRRVKIAQPAVAAQVERAESAATNRQVTNLALTGVAGLLAWTASGVVTLSEAQHTLIAEVSAVVVENSELNDRLTVTNERLGALEITMARLDATIRAQGGLP